jgi:uncharacterized YigZ family protein
MQEIYKTIETTSSTEFKDRGSKFLGYCFPIENKDDVKKAIQNLKDLHPKANHFCMAYRIGFDGNLFRSSDAGEPAGSAGKPILGQIDSAALTNVLIVVVRYFGGTLLGVPGLINAYKTTAALVLQTIPIVQKERVVQYELEFDYTQMNEMQKIVKQSRGVVVKNESSLFSKLIIDIPIVEQTFFLKSMERQYNVQCTKIQ